MPWCRLEDTFHDDPKWDLIADIASIPAVMVMGHASALYSWCVRHAPDGVIGTLPVSAIMRAMRIHDPKVFEIFVDHEVIIKTANGYEVNGYARRSETYNAAKRLAKHRKNKSKSETLQKRFKNADETEMKRDGNVEKRERREKRSEEREEIAHAVVRFHRDMLKSKHGIEPSAKISKNTIAYAAKIAALWPDDWRGVIEMYLDAFTEKRKTNRWPIGWLVEYQDDFDTQWRNRNVRVAKPQGDHLAKAAELERRYADMEAETARKNREEDERLAKQGDLL